MVLALAVGGNDLAVPCLWFNNREEGEKYLNSIEGLEHEKGAKSWLVKFEKGQVKFDTTKLFTSYYGGCGDVYAITLVDVEPAKPFIRWDLD